MKIVADSHIPYVKNYFSQYGELVLKSGRHITHEDVKDADILLVRSITHVDATLLKNSTVKFVGSVTAGADHLDTHFLDEADIAWSRAHGFNAPPVADYVVSVIAALQSKHLMPKTNLKAAVIGVGHVGTRVAAYLQALGMDVILCDPLRAEAESDFHSVALDDINNVDLITLHVPLTKSGQFPTHHFINSDFLRRQQAECIMINTSRGAIIDSNALLQHGEHLLWCLDVWEHEPHISEAVLERAIIATPHIAGYSAQSKMRGIDMIYHAACEKNMIQPQSIEPVLSAQHTLAFRERKYDWQSVVLGIFNPLILTSMMRMKISAAEDKGHAFDEMRNQFNYRQEFASTLVEGVQLDEQDAGIVTALGISVAR